MKRILLTGLGDKLGGTESFLKVLVDGLSKEYQFSILAATNAPYVMQDFFESRQIEVHQLEGIFGIKSVFQRGRILDSFFSEHQFDIVHINANTINAVYIAKAATRAGCRVIFQIHNAQPSGYPWYARILTELNKHIQRQYLHHHHIELISVSQDAAIRVFGKKLISSVQIIENGIDTDRYLFNSEKRSEIRNALKLGKDDKVAVVVARLMPIKNISRAIELFGQTGGQLLDNLIIVGTGPELESLCTQAKQLPDDLSRHVIFTGQKSNPSDYLSAADVFLATSIAEGLSISVIEAQASGLPVLASTGIPEITNVTGRVVYTDLDESNSVWLNKLSKFSLSGGADLFNQRIADNQKVASSEFSKRQFLTHFRDCYQ